MFIFTHAPAVDKVTSIAKCNARDDLQSRSIAVPRSLSPMSNTSVISC